MFMIRTETDSEVWKAVRRAGDRMPPWSPTAPVPPAGIIAIEHAQALWAAVIAQADRLVPRGQGRSAGAYGTDGRTASAVVTRANEDGTETVWFVEARSPNPNGDWTDSISIVVRGPWLDSHDIEWTSRAGRALANVIICDHHWYTVGRSGNGPGFGGRLFKFRELATGKVTESRNMWHGGTIPPAWRDKLPDTHEMLEGGHPTWSPV